jgi:hypothetical protein
MADEDREQDSLFKEVDEELRQEKYLALVRKYGVHALVLAVLAIASVAGFKGWQAYDLGIRQEQSKKFSEALRALDAKKTIEAERTLNALSVEGSGTYAFLARFKQAALFGRNGRRNAAIAEYMKLSGESGLDEIFRDLALLQATLLELDDGDPAQLSARLGGLTEGNNPWRHSAMEMSALLAHRAGDARKAVKLFKELADDATAPLGIRARAAEMTAILGG